MYVCMYVCMYVNQAKKSHHSKVLTLFKRCINSNVWVSLWITRENRLETAIDSLFT